MVKLVVTRSTSGTEVLLAEEERAQRWAGTRVWSNESFVAVPATGSEWERVEWDRLAEQAGF